MSAFAREAVLADEQRYKDATKSTETNQQKLDYATRYLLKNLRRTGIMIDWQIARRVIEAHVHRLQSPEAVRAERPPTAQQEEVLPIAQRPLAWT